MKRHTGVRPVSAPLVNGSTVALSEAPSIDESTTLANLQTAHSGEINAHARYLAFAKEADQEGYAPAASLFRAVAYAEKVHAGNHAEAIRGMGEEPKAEIEEVPVRSTHENLEAAIRGEVYERDEMYPSFLHEARSTRHQLAARSFHLAQKAESEHAGLFSRALEELERLRGEAIVYYVCPVCGFTSAKSTRSRCPVCSNLADRFAEVS